MENKLSTQHWWAALWHGVETNILSYKWKKKKLAIEYKKNRNKSDTIPSPVELVGEYKYSALTETKMVWGHLREGSEQT